MEDPSLLRQQIIASILTQQPENVADVAMIHWEKLANEIVSVVGEDGFKSLYERTFHLTKNTFPWLTPSSATLQPLQNNHRFVELGALLASQTPADACAAHRLLLTIFTDILASLIGEQLTSNILRAAWGDLASVTSSKELDNE
ncbi:hypothetical protein [Nitrincola sp. MINF-07-Sa-05]|uniref:hypothetical protein n=1 Tax=Nitrincola salilacus TaxID=3400273 RepID=UPI003917B7E7